MMPKNVLVLIAILLMTGGADAQLMDSAWPKFHHDLNNTGQSPYSSNSDGTLKWSYDTGGYIGYSSPAVDLNGTVYIGNYYNVHAIHPNGTLKWNYTATDGVFDSSSPAIGADGTIYVGSLGDDNKLYAIHSNGTLKWSYTTGDHIASSPAVGSDGTIYVGSFDNKLHAIHSNGTLKWSYTTGHDVDSSPAIGADGTIYVGSTDNKLYAIHSNGTLKWNYTTGGVIDSSPAIGADGTIYVGSYDNNLYAIHSNGTLKWNYTTGWNIGSSPAIGADGVVYVGSWDGYLYAIHSNGTLKWNYLTVLAGIDSSPAIGADGVVYVGSWSDNKLYAIHSNGTLKWSYTTNDDVYSSPAIGADGVVYVGSWDGNLYAFAVEKITVSCPVGWCYLALNHANKTLQQIDDMYSTDTIAGKFNSTSQKYENHRTGYAFNANVQVQQKEGYYVYFSTAKDVTMVVGNTPSITLKQNWNLVANYGTSNRTLAQLKSSIGASASSVKYYNKNLKLWVSTDSQSVPAMESFFVYLTQETVWNN